MTMRNKTYFIAAVIAWWSWISFAAYACICFHRIPVCEAYNSSSVIFIGEVSEITAIENRELRVRFMLQRSYRGVEGTEVEVVTGMGGGDCGYQFIKGTTYFVYAYRNLRDNRIQTSTCTRTRTLTDAGEDLAFFRELPNAAPGAGIQGSVW